MTYRFVFVAVLATVFVDRAFAQVELPLEARGELSSPRHTVTGDFDEDGDLDVAVTDGEGAGPFRVVLFPGDGVGGFATGVETLLPSDARDLRSLDLNNDGHLDWVAVTATHVVAGLGSGSGTFSVEQIVHAAGASAAVGDFDGDNLLDLVVLSVSATRQLHFLAGQGDGTFVAGPILTLAEPVRRIDAGDFNEDGSLDVVGIVAQGTQLFVGNGAGQFSAQAPVVNFGSFCNDLVVVDFDLDGHLDVAIRKRSTYEIQLGNGAGGFPGVVSSGSGPPQGDAGEIVTGDFDGNGLPDFASPSENNGNDAFLVVILNFGIGPLDRRVVEAWSSPHGLVAGDFNSDGLCDLVSTNEDVGSGSLMLHPGDGMGNFDASRIEHLDGTPEQIWTADLNSDGNLDVIVDNVFECLDTYLGDGNGSLVFQQRVVVGDILDVHTADLDDDGFLEVLVSTSEAQAIQVLEADGGGFLSPGVSLQFGEESRVGTLADLNSDDVLDLVILQRLSNQALLLFGLGGGVFSAPVTLPTDAWRPIDAAHGDFNGDGELDLAFANVSGDAVTIFEGDGSGSFALLATISIVIPMHLEVGDFDQDGRSDLLVARSNEFPNLWMVSLLLNSGFVVESIPLVAPAGPPTLMDVDLDGQLDVVLPAGELGALASSLTESPVLLGDGNGGFTPAPPVVTGRDTMSLASGDMNGDCIPELIAGNADLLVVLETITGDSADCNGNGLDDSCEIASGLATDCNQNGVPDSCDIAAGTVVDADGDGVPDSCFAEFVRGDVNSDNVVNIGDPIFLQGYLFLGGEAPSCLFAGDANEDGLLNVADSIFLLSVLFGGGPPLWSLDCMEVAITTLDCDSYPCP